jgi:hypothetical protein
MRNIADVVRKRPILSRLVGGVTVLAIPFVVAVNIRAFHLTLLETTAPSKIDPPLRTFLAVFLWVVPIGCILAGGGLIASAAILKMRGSSKSTTHGQS